MRVRFVTHSVTFAAGSSACYDGCGPIEYVLPRREGALLVQQATQRGVRSTIAQTRSARYALAIESELSQPPASEQIAIAKAVAGGGLPLLAEYGTVLGGSGHHNHLLSLSPIH